MKKIFFIVALLISALFSFSQSTVLIRGDTVRLYKQGDSSYTKVDSFLFVTKQASIGYPYLPLSTSALLELNSTSMGFRTSRMTAAQRLAISSPGAANFVWDSDSLRFLGHNGTVWKGLAWTGEAGAGAGSTALSSITAAVAANTINSGNNEQEWQWNTLAGKNAFTISSNSPAATGDAQILFRVALSGTNANSGEITSAATITNDHAGTGAINTALAVGASNGLTNYSIYSDPGINYFGGEVQLGTLAQDDANTKILTRGDNPGDPIEWRDVSTIGGGEDLHATLTIGNTSSLDIYTARFGVITGVELPWYAEFVANAGDPYGLMSFRSPGGGFRANFSASASLSANRTYTMPNYSGVLGVHPSITGEAGKVLAVNGTETGLEWITAGGAGLVDGDYGDITVGGSGTTMTYDFRRFMAIATVVATDADITAVAGTVYSLPAATLTQNRNIDMTNVNVNGDYIEFDNQEAGFTWTFTGQTVYDAMENPVTTLFGQLRYIIRRSNGKLKIIN